MKKTSKVWAGTAAAVLSFLTSTGCEKVLDIEAGCLKSSFYRVTCKDGTPNVADFLKEETILECIDADGNATNISFSSKSRNSENFVTGECDGEGVIFKVNAEDVQSILPDRFGKPSLTVTAENTITPVCKGKVITPMCQ